MDDSGRRTTRAGGRLGPLSPWAGEPADDLGRRAGPAGRAGGGGGGEGEERRVSLAPDKPLFLTLACIKGH